MSSTENATTCPACGARLAPDADACDLCGTPVAATDLPQVEAPNERDEGPDPESASPDAAAAADPVYCNACGWENPPAARFCSQCGEALQDMSAEQARPVAADLPRRTENASDEDAGSDDADHLEGADGASTPLMTKQVGMVIGGAVLAVIVLFAATTWSQQMEWGASGSEPAAPMASPGAASAQPSTAPADLETLVRENANDSVPEPLRSQIATLEDEMAQQTDVEQRATQQELANLYIGAGQLGRAALVQQRIAEASGDPDAWRRAGDLLYSWMETFEGQQPVSSSVAEYVVTAYQKVLDQQPDNLDVRTDMATAFLQTNQPMRGVQAINRVLEEDPNHFQARFNKGIMLTMIGRAEEAIQEFERVKEIVGTDSPYHQQAEQAIQTIRQRMDREGGSS